MVIKYCHIGATHIKGYAQRLKQMQKKVGFLLNVAPVSGGGAAKSD